MPCDRIHRVAMLSVHTSPLEQPGTGDAGGLNVYVVEVARQLARRNVAVEIFTRTTTADLPPTVELEPGVLVRHVTAGPYEGLGKEDLPGQLCAFAAGVMRTGAHAPENHYSLIHSHYWLSGQVGWLAADRWQVPLVHTMHTMARVKNQYLADGESPEPSGREIGELQVVEAADRLIANTLEERHELIDLYAAEPEKVVVVPPGVDLSLFAPGDVAAARAQLGLPQRAKVLLFVGRIQPLKAPEVLVKAAAELLARHPDWRDELVVAVLGGPSGSGLAHPRWLEDLSDALGVAQQVRFVPPVARTEELAQWYRAADLVAVPSHSESFGLVAVEAQACGTPVVAARVGGLPTAVGEAGVLVAGHGIPQWADALEALLLDPARREALSRKAIQHAALFGWDRTTERLFEVYVEACRARAQTLDIPSPNGVLAGVPAAVVPWSELRSVVEKYLASADVEWEPGARDGEYVVTLPGERKLKTVASLLAGNDALSVSAFVIRNPDENHEQFYRLLLRRNLRLPGLAYAVDASGDVYLTGRLPAPGVDAPYLDQLLGVLLDAADTPFNELLATGFRTSMQKEWDWRVSRGESLRNLEAFRHLLEHD